MTFTPEQEEALKPLADALITNGLNTTEAVGIFVHASSLQIQRATLVAEQAKLVADGRASAAANAVLVQRKGAEIAAVEAEIQG